MTDSWSSDTTPHSLVTGSQLGHAWSTESANYSYREPATCNQKQVFYSAINHQSSLVSEEYAANAKCMQHLITCRHTAREGSPHNVLHFV